VKFNFRAVRVAFVVFLIFFIVPAVAAPASPVGRDAAPNRQYLRFFQIDTGEKLDVVYGEGDSYVPE